MPLAARKLKLPKQALVEDEPFAFPPFELYPQQRELLELMKRSRHFAHRRYQKMDCLSPEEKAALRECDGPVKFALICHRQWGKDVMTAVFCVWCCLRYPGTTVYYAYPTAKRARHFWFRKNVDIEGCMRMWHMIPRHKIVNGKPNHTLGLIEFTNGSLIQTCGMEVGSDDVPNATERGGGLHIVVYSEYAYAPQNGAASEVYGGMGAAYDHISIYPSTLKRKNHFYQRTKPYWDKETCHEEDKDDWHVLRLNREETSTNEGELIVSQQAYDAFRRENGEAKARQEFYNDVDVPDPGSVFGPSMAEIRAKGRIMDQLMPKANLPTFTGWDYGGRNATVVIYAQLEGEFLNILDAKSYTATNIRRIVHEVLAWQKEHGIPAFERHFLAHDFANATQHLPGEAGISNLLKVVKTEGLRPCRRVPRPKVKVDVAVEAVRVCMDYMRFDRFRCWKLIESLDDYSHPTDPITGRFDTSKVVKKGESEESDYNDALQTLCMPLLGKLTSPRLRQRRHEGLELASREDDIYAGLLPEHLRGRYDDEQDSRSLMLIPDGYEDGRDFMG